MMRCVDKEVGRFVFYLGNSGGTLLSFALHVVFSSSSSSNPSRLRVDRPDAMMMKPAVNNKE
jgi:hypothetical protein